MPSKELVAFVLIDPAGYAVGTTWEDRGRDAVALAVNLYGPGATAYLADDMGTAYYAAMEREWRATHVENEAIQHLEKIRAWDRRITEKLHALFPWLRESR